MSIIKLSWINFFIKWLAFASLRISASRSWRYDFARESVGVEVIKSFPEPLHYTGPAEGLEASYSLFSPLATWGSDRFFLVYVDASLRVRIVHLHHGRAAPTQVLEDVFLVDDEYRSKDAWTSGYSIGIDETGHIHVAGENSESMDDLAHLATPFREGKCMLWRSERHLNVTAMIYRGQGGGSHRCFPNHSVSLVRFFSDIEGRLYAHYRVAVKRADDDARIDRGLGMSRFDPANNEWVRIGAEEGTGLLAFELSSPSDVGAPSLMYGQVQFDSNDVLHVGFEMNGEDGRGQEPSLLFYAFSADHGASFKRSDGSCLALPMRGSLDPHAEDRADVAYNCSRSFYNARRSNKGTSTMPDGVVHLFVTDHHEEPLIVTKNAAGEWDVKLATRWPPADQWESLQVHKGQDGIPTMQTKNGLLRFGSVSEPREHELPWKRLMIDVQYHKRTGTIAALSKETTADGPGTLELLQVYFLAPATCGVEACGQPLRPVGNTSPSSGGSSQPFLPVKPVSVGRIRSPEQGRSAAPAPMMMGYYF